MVLCYASNVARFLPGVDAPGIRLALMIDIKKGQFGEIVLRGETTWVKVEGDHNDGGLQVRLAVPFEGEEFKMGDMIRIERERIMRVLPPDDDR